jgi:hypothetical protein
MVSGFILAVSAILVGRGGNLRWFLVLFFLGMMAAIAALHLLHGRRGALASATAFVGAALMTGGYILIDFIISLEGVGTILFLVGALVAGIGMIGLAIVTSSADVLSWWCGLALLAGNPLLQVFLYLVFYGSNLSVAFLLWAVPWIAVGFAVFLAAGRRTEQRPRVR